MNQGPSLVTNKFQKKQAKRPIGYARVSTRQQDLAD